MQSGRREIEKVKNSAWRTSEDELWFTSNQQAKEDIETAERKIEKERREKLPNWEIEVRMSKYDIDSAKYTIKKERIELHKPLNYENDFIRQGSKRRISKISKPKKRLGDKKLQLQ